MKVFLALLCVAVVAAGKDSVTPVPQSVKVRTAWVRHFSNTALGIFPDNLGCIAAVGNDTNGGIAVLLNTRGRQVANVPVPISGIASGVADKSGRIFITGKGFQSPIVRSAAFAPSLSHLLWAEQKNLSNAFSPPSTAASLGSTVPDESGKAYVHGSWNRGFFLTEFRGDNSGLLSFWEPNDNTYGRWPVTGVRSPSGEIYFVCASVGLGHYYFITIQKFIPATGELITHGATAPYGGYSLPRAAACDSDGNLIVVGWYSDDSASFYRRGNYFTLKMDSQLNVLWRARYGPITSLTAGVASLANGVAVDENGDIVVTGWAGTVKYSPAGQQFWDAPETGTTIRLDQFSNVLLSKQVGRADGLYESEITKLNANGTRRWQIRYHDGGPTDNGPAGLIPGDDGDVYFASQNGQDTAIVRFVETGRAGERTGTAAGHR